MNRKWIVFVFSVVLAVALSGQPAAGPASVKADGVKDHFVYLPAVNKARALMCRFGVATVNNPSQFPLWYTPYDPTEGYANAAHLKQLKAGSLVDWGRYPGAVLDPEITYLHVIRVVVGGNVNVIIGGLAENVAKYPNQYWQIGNEPDVIVARGQDGVTPEVYASQYFAIATELRRLDPGAKIGFGAIVQPTPIRLFYLQLAWNELVRLADNSPTKASALVDFWTTHAFILNEQDGKSWGAGLPDFDENTENIPAGVVITSNNKYAEIYNLGIFKSRIEAMRGFMNRNGERAKPLWITEYGVLFPPIDPPDDPYDDKDPVNKVNVSDATTAAFMVSTFDYLRSAASTSTGMPDDGNRLVQRWFWYSLNDYPYVFGGTLFHPSTGAITPVGQAYANYTAGLQPDENCK